MREPIRRLLRLLAALVLGAAAHGAELQYTGLNFEDTALQKYAIEAERRGIFHRAWAAADASRRSTVQALLERHASKSSAFRDQPDLALLALATRILRGAEGALVQNDPLTRLADGMDVFTGPVDIKGERGRSEGEVLTAGVRLLKPMTSTQFPEGEVQVSLVWLAADGSLVPAQSGVFGREDFNRGFPMAIGTPPKPQGILWLMPILRLGDQEVRGWAVPVPFVTDYAARTKRLQQGTRLMFELGAVLKWGRIWVRRCDRLGPSEWLRRMEAGEVGGSYWPPDVFLPRSAAERPVVLLVAAPTETAAALLTGPSGKAWMAAAETHDFHLACADASELAGPKLQNRVSHLLRESGSSRLILVLRGDAAVSVMLSLRSLKLPALSGLVLVNSFGSLVTQGANLATLLVGCRGDEQSDAPGVERRSAAGTLLLADTLLPDLFAAWFAKHWAD
jgi:hypothetical protein